MGELVMAEGNTRKCIICGVVGHEFYWINARLDEKNDDSEFHFLVPVCEECAVGHFSYPDKEERDMLEIDGSFDLEWTWETVDEHEKRKTGKWVPNLVYRDEEYDDEDEGFIALDESLFSERMNVDDSRFEDDDDTDSLEEDDAREIAERAIERLRFIGEIADDEFLSDEDEF
jgi:hypothetical protein